MNVLMLEQVATIAYKYTFSLANAIKNHGVNIDVVIDMKEERENATFNRIQLFNTDQKDISKLKKFTNYLKSYKKIEQLIKENDYDVLHTQWFICAPIDYYFIQRLKKKHNIKIVSTVHDILPFNQKFYDLYYHQKLYKLADHIIVQATNNLSRFNELFPDSYSKVKMIPHGHFLEYAQVIDQKKARNYLNLNAEKLMLLFFGQIKKVKGVNILLEAYSKICQKYPDTFLVIAGSVWKDDFSIYQNIIDANELRDSVRCDIRFIPDEEVKYYYSATDFCVLPYTDVYQSGVIQLSYAYRKPVVASNIGAFREIVKDNETGFLCNPNNVDSLAYSLENAIKNKDNLNKMGLLGYSYIKEKFSWDKIATETIQLYLN